MFTRPARYLPPTLGLVTIPAALERKAVGSIRRRQHDAGRVGDPRKSRFIIQSLFARALKQLRRVTPFTDLTSTWTGYVDAHHTPAYHDAKRRIVEDFLRTHTPSRVLDIGCNTGDYSVLAARCGARVVAVDSDEAVISRLWHRARKERADILPLVVNIARPSPAVGWLNRECYSFLERAEGVFDTVLMLALVHHLLVTERIPFEQIIRLAARLTSRFCVIEFVPSDDPKFQELTGGWNELYTHWTHDLFRQHCARYFETVAEVPLRDSDRWLHLLAKRTA
jgi:SAM-dependent methyltransferase